MIALLSWYEEPASWLAECVASVAKLCDHIVAVDGPYAMFPGALKKPASGSEQAEVITHTAAGAGIGSTIHIPRRPWWGNEVEKRDFMFRLAMTFADPEDWFLRIDADEVLTHVPPDTRRKLADTDHAVAAAMMWERGDGQDSQHPIRVLFRALPGIGVEQAHYVVTADGVDGKRRVLCGNELKHHHEPAAELWDLRMEHRKSHRSAMRQAIKNQYYGHLPELEKVSPL